MGGDNWHYAMARIVVAARAHGLRPVDGPFGDISDPDGYKAQANRGAVLGCEGKWAIHPSQVALANEVFSPSEAEVTKAKRILDAMEQAQRDGLGAVPWMASSSILHPSSRRSKSSKRLKAWLNQFQIYEKNLPWAVASDNFASIDCFTHWLHCNI